MCVPSTTMVNQNKWSNGCAANLVVHCTECIAALSLIRLQVGVHRTMHNISWQYYRLANALKGRQWSPGVVTQKLWNSDAILTDSQICTNIARNTDARRFMNRMVILNRIQWDLKRYEVQVVIAQSKHSCPMWMLSKSLDSVLLCAFFAKGERHCLYMI